MNKKQTYKIFDYKLDRNYYWITALCTNCLNTEQIGILKGIKVNSSRLRLMTCPRCQIRKSLVQAVWDGKKYVKVTDKK